MAEGPRSASYAQSTITFLGELGEPQGSYGTNQAYRIGGECQVSWTSTYAGVDIWLSKLFPALPVGQRQLQSNITDGSYTWTPQLDDFPEGTEPGGDAVFQFQAYEVGSRGWPAMSHAFNLTAPEKSSRTSQPLPTAPTSTARPSTGPPEPTLDVGSDATLSRGAVAGVAVGVLAAVALIALGVGLLVWRRTKRHQQRLQDESDEDAALHQDKFSREDVRNREDQVCSELEGDGAVYELSCDGEIRRELDGAATMRFPPPPGAENNDSDQDGSDSEKGFFQRHLLFGRSRDGRPPARPT